MTSRKVTVGMPVYNGERYLERSLSSVLTQDFEDLEVIVADNASTDGSRDIVLDAASRDARVRLLPSDTNRGAAWNYNRLVGEGTGTYFRWHADDDFMEPRLIGACVEALDADPGLVLAYSWTRFVDDDGTLVREYRDQLQIDDPSPHRRLASIVRDLTYCNAAFSLLRRDVLARTALIRPFPGSDVSLLYELSALGRFAIVPEFLFVRRPGNSVNNRPTREIADWFQPGGPGRRLPAWFLYRTMIERILAMDELPMAERARLLGVMHTVWPRVHLGRAKRRYRRAARAAATA